MGGASLLVVLATTTALLWLASPVNCGSPRIAHSQYVYQYEENDQICVYGSFEISFDIFFENTETDSQSQQPHKRLYLPDRHGVSVNGSCSQSEPELLLRWQKNSLRMTFGKGKGEWELKELTLVYYLNTTEFTNATKHGLQSIHTNGSDLFKRKFKTSEYFYCKNCKTYEFGGYNESVCQDSCQSPCVVPVNSTASSCSSIHMEKSVIFVGDPSKASKRLCLEDFIALQEIIVPIAVGGVLALLLILIFVAYIIAYVRRRRREAKSQYEPVGDF
jgi:hypothetical protein